MLLILEALDVAELAGELVAGEISCAAGADCVLSVNEPSAAAAEGSSEATGIEEVRL